MTIIEQARELLALTEKCNATFGVHEWNEVAHAWDDYRSAATPEAIAALCRALIARDEALERIVGMCDCEDGNIGRCGNCGRPNGIPAIVACAERALTDDGLPREG